MVCEEREATSMRRGRGGIGRWREKDGGSGQLVIKDHGGARGPGPENKRIKWESALSPENGAGRENRASHQLAGKRTNV